MKPEVPLLGIRLIYRKQLRQQNANKRLSLIWIYKIKKATSIELYAAMLEGMAVK